LIKISLVPIIKKVVVIGLMMIALLSAFIFLYGIEAYAGEYIEDEYSIYGPFLEPEECDLPIGNLGLPTEWGEWRWLSDSEPVEETSKYPPGRLLRNP
jgi:hypothetical protein